MAPWKVYGLSSHAYRLAQRQSLKVSIINEPLSPLGPSFATTLRNSRRWKTTSPASSKDTMNYIREVEAKALGTRVHQCEMFTHDELDRCAKWYKLRIG